jgi:hypothetical protein
MTNDFLKLLKPQNVFLTKKRIGPPEDGGYVMPEFVLENCSALFTYGVGYDERYEAEFCKLYNKPAYLFDHTIGREPWSGNGMTFKPEGLGYGENCKEVFEHYTELGITGDIFLKIDVEGYEYEYFTKSDTSKLGDYVMGLSLEVHWFEHGTNRENLEKILLNLSEHFILCHVHANNWGYIHNFDGVDVPIVLELSFINRKYVDAYEPDNQDYPIEGLDIPNNPNAPDYPLTFLKTL